jgi:hypothetical protein
MSKLLHISFNFHGRPTNIEELKPAFNLALDWVTYAPNCWIVHTSSEVDVWYRRLKPLLHDADGMLIFEINLNTQSGWVAGFLPPFVWDWLRRTTNRQIGDLPMPKLSSPDPKG